MPRLGTLHRWITLVSGLQLLLWTTSGLIFTLDPIETVRGEDTLPIETAEPIPLDGLAVSLPAAVRAALESGRLDPPVTGVSLGEDRERLAFSITGSSERTLLVDASTGAVLPPLRPDEAAQLVRSRYRSEPPPAVKRSFLIESDAPLEYAGPLPVMRVDLDDGRETHVYLDPETGRILKRRNATWRRFDFFWMLHIMDYSERTDFSTPWLTGFALLGVATSLTGLALLVVHYRRRWRSRHRRARVAG